MTGLRWLDSARGAGVEAVELMGLDPDEGDDDTDAGAKIHHRAARMAVLNLPELRRLEPDLVVSDVITVCGGMAAELLGLPWVELTPHPLYLPSRGLPPIGSGLAPGTGVSGRLRDTVMRAFTARSIRTGDQQRSAARAGIGLPARDPGPRRRLIATLPALEVPRPDWPREAVVVGPLHFEPTAAVLDVPPGDGPVVVVAPSTAGSGAAGLAELALQHLVPGLTLPAGARLVVSRLGGDDVAVPPWATVGLGRQDDLLRRADVVVCGGGHGMLSKALLAGVPVVVAPGGGDQWELANRVVRQGSGRLVRPLTGAALAAEVAEVLSDPRYREAARRAGESVAAVTDPVRVCQDATR
jgi:UDP:flavonoid glycosyltransferase YjiC (YdhE family)